MVNTWHCPLDGSALAVWPNSDGISNSSLTAGCPLQHRWTVIIIEGGSRLVFAEVAEKQDEQKKGRARLLEALAARPRRRRPRNRGATVSSEAFCPKCVQVVFTKDRRCTTCGSSTQALPKDWPRPQEVRR